MTAISGPAAPPASSLGRTLIRGARRSVYTIARSQASWISSSSEV